jgi:hypothetical protein
MTKTMVTVVLLSSACLHAADQEATEGQRNIIAADQKSARATRFWKISLAGLAAANALDVGSSWKKRELNGMLRSPDGTSGPRGILIKMGLQGGLLATEYPMIRHDWKGTRHRLAAWMNLAASAAIAAVAARNLTVPRQ